MFPLRQASLGTPSPRVPCGSARAGASSAIPYLGGKSTGGNPRASDRHRVPEEQRPPWRSRQRQESAGVTPATQRPRRGRLLRRRPALAQRCSDTAPGGGRAGGSWVSSSAGSDSNPLSSRQEPERSALWAGSSPLLNPLLMPGGVPAKGTHQGPRLSALADPWMLNFLLLEFPRIFLMHLNQFKQLMMVVISLGSLLGPHSPSPN